MNKWLVLAAALALGKMLHSAKPAQKKSDSPGQPPEPAAPEEPAQKTSDSPARQEYPPQQPRLKRRYKTIDGVLHEQNPLGFGWREVGSDPDEPYWVRRLD